METTNSYNRRAETRWKLQYWSVITTTKIHITDVQRHAGNDCIWIFCMPYNSYNRRAETRWKLNTDMKGLNTNSYNRRAETRWKHNTLFLCYNRIHITDVQRHAGNN